MEGIINVLKKIFNEPLPGAEAQKKMSPSVRFTENIFHNEKEARNSSVFILLYQKEEGWYVPFIKRQIYNGAHSGQIGFPGGKFESGDGSLINTAFRETEEEIGIGMNVIEYIGSLTSLYIPNSNFMVYPQVGVIRKPTAFMPDSREVSGVLEAPLSALMHPCSIQQFSRTINGIEVTAPFFNISSQQVWGATAMIMSEFLQILKSHADELNPLLRFYNGCNVQEFQ